MHFQSTKLDDALTEDDSLMKSKKSESNRYNHVLDHLAAEHAVLFTSGARESDKDFQIWNAFRSGSREAFNYIFHQHGANLFSYGSRFTKNANLVEDSIQDVFVELWNRRESLSETNSIKFYLLKSLRRRIIRTMLGERRSEVIAEDAYHLEEKINFSIEHVLISEEVESAKKIRLKKAIDSLTKRQRESIYLKFFQGLDNPSIAAVMGLHETSVNTLVSQALSALRAKVG